MIEPIATPTTKSQLGPGTSEVDRLGDRIAELSAKIQAATYHLLVLIREFDEKSGWSTGFRSCAHWLNWRTGLDLGAAREKVRVAKALGELPLLSEAMGCGELSYSKVRALTRVATRENEAELLEFARAGTAAHVEKLVRAWRRVDRQDEVHRENLRHASRYLEATTDYDGMIVLRARLEPEVGAALLKALEAAEQVLYDRERETKDERGDGVPVRQRRADALGLVAESALAGGIDNSTRAERLQVVVHVESQVLEDPDAPGVSMLEDGTDVSAETSSHRPQGGARIGWHLSRSPSHSASTRRIPSSMRVIAWVVKQLTGLERKERSRVSSCDTFTTESLGSWLVFFFSNTLPGESVRRRFDVTTATTTV